MESRSMSQREDEENVPFSFPRSMIARRSYKFCCRTLPLWLVWWCSILALAVPSVAKEDNTHNQPTIPIIDLRPWTTPSSYPNEDRQQVVKQIQVACETIGFFAITGHGVPSTILNDLLETSRSFFDLPPTVKQQYQTDNETIYPYGYEHSETLSHSKYATDKTTVSNPDPKETFSLGPYNPDCGMPPRRLPESPPGLAAALEHYYLAMEGLTNVLLEIFALALDLPAQNWFQDKINRHLCALRLLNYPPLLLKHGNNKPSVRASPHTDYGVLTILYSGGPGLQVQPDTTTTTTTSTIDNDTGAWTDVPHLPNTFIINLGDLMQRWTNDQWVSTLHRVIVPSIYNETMVPRRQSIAFFVNVNADTLVVPMDARNHPPSTRPITKYKPILAKDYLMKKHLASMNHPNGDEL